MSVPVTITLNSIVGTPGPFSLYSCVGVTCSGTPFETGVSLSSLQSGYGTSLAPDGTTDIKIVSTGSCPYEIKKSISGLPTPTVTPTPQPTVTPTPPPTIYSGDIWFGNTPSDGFSQACSGGAHQEYLFWSGSQQLYEGLVFYTDPGLLYPWSNSLNQYSYCRSDGSGGGFGEMNLSGNVVGPATGTLC